MIWSFFLSYILLFIRAANSESTTNNNNNNDTTVTTCNLLTFVPFTFAEKTSAEITLVVDSNNDKNNSNNETTTTIISNNLGYSQMASAAMAIKHFNERNTSVIQNLNVLLQDCEDLILSSRFYDTGTMNHTSTYAVQMDIIQNNGEIPCGIAGPYTDLPSQFLGTIAAGLHIPLVATRAINLRATRTEYSPFSTQVYPDQTTLGRVLIQYLFHTGRTNYINILYPILDTSIQIQEVITVYLNSFNITYNKYSYDYDVLPNNGTVIDSKTSSASKAFEKMKNDGYRTIVVIFETSNYEIDILAKMAEKYNINTEEYVWIFLGVDLGSLAFSNFTFDFNNNIDIYRARLLTGGAMISPMEDFQINPNNDTFLHAWQSQDSDFVNEVNNMQTIPVGQPGYYNATSDYFQKYNPGTGSAYLYDAVMSIGIGACNAHNSNNNNNNINNRQKNNKIIIDGTEHLFAIRVLDFLGATGRVRFGHGNEYLGERDPEYVKYGVINLLPLFTQSNESEWSDLFKYSPLSSAYEVTSTLESNGNDILISEWKVLTPFLYRSGSTEPPILLRTTPEQNYLSKEMRIFGLTLMSIVLIASVLASIWLYFSRNHPVVRRNQPFALQFICLGSFVTSWGILPISFDESYGWSTDRLNIGCNANVWSVVLGYLITYGAIFAKLWRLDKVLQFRRREVRVIHVAWPTALFCLTAIVMLTVMTIVDPLQYERKEINIETGESIGRCVAGNATLLYPVAVVMLLSTLLTGFMAYKTLDVDSSFSDAYWVLALIFVHLEVILLGLPVSSILSDLNTDGRYFGIIFIIFTFPASSLGLIILPKVVAYYRTLRGRDIQKKRGAGGTGQVHVYQGENFQTTGASMTTGQSGIELPNQINASGTIHRDESKQQV